MHAISQCFQKSKSYRHRSWAQSSMARLLTGVALGLAVSQASLQAADKKTPDPKQAALTAEAAGSDFDLQGEYSGTLNTGGESLRLGVQVIALGSGKFKAVGYPGGLPGDGWGGEKRIQVEGELKDGTVHFASDEGGGVLRNGQLEIVGEQGVKLGELKKVIRKSPTLGKKPPEGAVVLFDGTTAEHFKGGRLTDESYLREGVTSNETFGDFTLHMEFMLSFMPHARGQGRSNSGAYMQGRYEVQILDSFGLTGEHNECGGIYELHKPAVNMCFPPLSWQTYDVDFQAARYDDDGNKVTDATVTVRHNGEVIHQNVKLPRGTRAAPVKEGPEPGPLYIQNHGNPLWFRNIWVVPQTKAAE